MFERIGDYMLDEPEPQEPVEEEEPEQEEPITDDMDPRIPGN